MLKKIGLESIKKIVVSIVCIIILTAINCLLLTGSFMLPTSIMRDNVAKSKELVEAEGQYWQWDNGYTATQIDGWSEYRLYAMAINEDSEGSAFEQAMLMRTIDTYGDYSDQSLVRYAVNKDEEFTQDIYARYWNGSVMFLKVLLLFFDMSEIRMFGYFVQFSLLFLVFFLLIERKLNRYIIPFTVGILFINPITMAYSYKYAVEYVPMLVALVVILKWDYKLENSKYGWVIFYSIIGSVTSFLCWFSFPAITLGVPLIVMIWVGRKERITKKVVELSIFWGVGYVLTYILKLLVCSLFTSYNAFDETFGRAHLYANTDISGGGMIGRIMRNLWVIYNPVFVLCFVAGIILVCISVMNRKTCNEADVCNVNYLDLFTGYIITALIPLAVIICLGDRYAYVHFYMAHRQFAISIISALCIIQLLLEQTSKKSQK